MLLKEIGKWFLFVTLFFGGVGLGLQANVVGSDLMGTFATFMIFMALLCLGINTKE